MHNSDTFRSVLHSIVDSSFHAKRRRLLVGRGTSHLKYRYTCIHLIRRGPALHSVILTERPMSQPSARESCNRSLEARNEQRNTRENMLERPPRNRHRLTCRHQKQNNYHIGTDHVFVVPCRVVWQRHRIFVWQRTAIIKLGIHTIRKCHSLKGALEIQS